MCDTWLGVGELSPLPSWMVDSHTVDILIIIPYLIPNNCTKSSENLDHHRIIPFMSPASSTPKDIVCVASDATTTTQAVSAPCRSLGAQGTAEGRFRLQVRSACDELQGAVKNFEPPGAGHRRCPEGPHTPGGSAAVRAIEVQNEVLPGR